MDGLNSSVITGKCSGCTGYKAQVARLEAEAKKQERARRLIEEANAEMAAALEGILRAFTPEHMDSVSGTTVGSDARTALSPDAGEGRLPPEVREQDVEAAIYFMEQAKTTHEEWAAYIISGGELPEFVGDLERHQEYIQEYEHTIDVLNTVRGRATEASPRG